MKDGMKYIISMVTKLAKSASAAAASHTAMVPSLNAAERGGTLQETVGAILCRVVA